MILWLFCILAEKKSRNFKNYIAPGHLWRRPLLISAILNENIKSSRFALQKCGHNRDTEPNRLFLFCACMRVLIWMDLNNLWKLFYAGEKKKKRTTLLCAWGNHTAEASVSEIKGVWQEKQKKLRVSCWTWMMMIATVSLQSPHNLSLWKYFSQRMLIVSYL